MKLRKGRPSPAMVVAVAALVFAVAGTAMAGVATISVLNKQEKKQVGKIADKRITARAGNLSVKKADSAEAANTANTANTAGNVSNQLWAIVNADGTLFRGSPGIVGAAPDAPGRTIITADRDLSNCFSVATLGGNTPNGGFRGDTSVDPIAGSPNELFVLTSDTSTPPQNSPIPFTVLIRC